MAYTDLTGKKFYNLTVESFVRKDKSRQNHWKCRCDCGNTIITRGAFLTKGFMKSCGCPVKKPPINPEEIIPELGQMERFDPFQNITGFASDINRGNYQTGEVIYVNEPHKWFSVDFGGQRTSFKFCEIGDTVKLL